MTPPLSAQSESLARAFNQARNALVAGRSALACREPLSDRLRDEMSRAIAACEDAVLDLPAAFDEEGNS